jgi:chitinase
MSFIKFYFIYLFFTKKPLFPRIIKLKEKNPKLKILISTGGWGKASEFDMIARSEEVRMQFCENVIQFCRQWGFDGIDLG